MRLTQDWQAKAAERNRAEVAYWKSVLRAQRTNPFIEEDELAPLEQKIKSLQTSVASSSLNAQPA